jgi:uncharacterized phage protein gp47/JayE
MPNVPFDRQHARDHAAAMIGWFLGLSADTAGRVTDFNIGSNMRTLLESVAMRLEHLDSKMYLGLRRAIPLILYEFFGEGDGVTTTVGFPPLPAEPARGIARFEHDGVTGLPIPIPVSTLLVQQNDPTATPVTYATLVPATLTGPTVDIPIACQVAGPTGTVPAGVLRLQTNIAGIRRATNTAAMTGMPAETEDQRRQRFVKYIRNLARAQLAGLEVGACTTQLVVNGTVTERVVAARALNVPDKRGLVDVYIDNGGATATPALVAECQRLLEGYIQADGSRVHGYVAAGVTCRVQAVVPQIVPVTATLLVDPAYRLSAVAPAVDAAVRAYFASLAVFDACVRSELVGVIATVPGVIDHTLTSPAANIITARGVRVVCGEITLTEQVGYAA